jgi:phosphatidylserine/phosphatidylglycerophosphate/cardiolipin synthase-like enzyme
MFTENKRLPDAIIRAHKRGVNIKILLEKNPYKTPTINNKIFNMLSKN